MALEDEIQREILGHHDNPVKDTKCNCGSGGLRHVKCRSDGCSNYPASCVKCYVESHRWNPFHWPLVWDPEAGYWVKHEHKDLLPEGEPCFRVGHEDVTKPCPWSKGTFSFQVTNINGIHSSRISFCDCPDNTSSRLDQLLQAQLFPATITDPQSAFTFALLKQFRMHNYQSKCGAFDYMKSFRRFTNNVINRKTPVSMHPSYL